MLRLPALVFITLFCIVHANGITRKLSASINPGNEHAHNITLVHIAASGDNDELHYIWDFTRAPTILVVQTERNANVSIHWQHLATRGTAVRFVPPPTYSMAFVLTKIFVYDDAEDKVTMIGIDQSAISAIPLSELTWSRDVYEASASAVGLQLSGRNKTLLGDDGIVRINLTCHGSQGVEPIPPHLSHSINATEINVELIDVNATVRAMRVGAEIALVANESVPNAFNVAERKLIDDGRAPGEFRMVDVLSPGAMNNSKGSYIQFRPIAYKNESRSLNAKTDIHFNPPMDLDDPTQYLRHSMAWSFYGDKLEQMLVQTFNFSFGERNDDYYNDTNYVAWTFVYGYGYAEPESISVVAIVVACLVLGLPLLVLMAAGIYLGIKRWRNC